MRQSLYTLPMLSQRLGITEQDALALGTHGHDGLIFVAVIPDGAEAVVTTFPGVMALPITRPCRALSLKSEHEISRALQPDPQ
ncbi:hypothetical protein, partial [Imhoffiella purpurea]|uniref:hypothetical protein n=1 Tax=Imhoffiella purpurea TaxID=1249627 RepID=UPI0005C25F10